MSQDIRSTITSAVGTIPGGYSSYLDRAVEAVQAREFEATDTLVEVAESKGLSASEARQIVEGAGLTIRPAPVAEVAASNGSSVDTDAALAAASRISEAANDLVAALGGIAGR